MNAHHRPAHRRQVRVLPPLVLAGAGVVAGALALLDLDDGALGHVRLAATIGFVLLGPGWALVGFVRDLSTPMTWLLAAASGVAMGLLVGQAMAMLGWWYPVPALVLTAVLCSPVLVRHAVVAASGG